MILRCPKCEQHDLTDADHGASRCTACGGMFVPGTRLHETFESAEQPLEHTSANAKDAIGGTCPADHSIMSRTQIALSNGSSIHLERCSSCQGVWFDAGEWSELSADHLLDHIAEFWSEEWRSRQRRALEQQEYRKRLEQAFGPPLLAQIHALAAALRNHPRRSQALAVLRDESSSNRPAN